MKELKKIAKNQYHITILVFGLLLPYLSNQCIFVHNILISFIISANYIT